MSLDDETAARLRAAAETLEAVAADRGLLETLSNEERARLLTAAADVFEPDVVRRRQSSKAFRRRTKAARIERDKTALAETGIRTLRDKPVYTSII